MISLVRMPREIVYVGVAALLFLMVSSAHAVTIDWVTVGDPGNAADTTGYGAVADAFRIGKYEVTIGQYTDFLNAVAATDTSSLYNASGAVASSFRIMKYECTNQQYMQYTPKWHWPTCP
jgi:sulfatase modifying factor 1